MVDKIQIRLSVGAILLAVLHAVLLALVFTALHTPPLAEPTEPNAWQLPTVQPSTAPTGAIEKLAEPQTVNLEAQGELKQQIPCEPCSPTRLVRRPTVVQPTVVHPATQPVVRPTAPVVTPQPAPDSGVPFGGSSESRVTPVANPASPPPKKAYQLALFVASDSQSQKLQQWFSEDPRLATLKSKCEFQVYTTSNAIYRTRFADLVPAEHFPVVLFQDSSGGHIHAAGRSMIPSSPEELYSDLRQGFELYQQAKQAQRTGAVKARGYSWDDAISPTLYLAADDCPDGYCPTEPEDTWRPGDRVRDVLFDEARDTRNALMWVSAGEIATLALIVLAVILLGFILIKRGM